MALKSWPVPNTLLSTFVISVGQKEKCKLQKKRPRRVMSFNSKYNIEEIMGTLDLERQDIEDLSLSFSANVWIYRQ